MSVASRHQPRPAWPLKPRPFQAPELKLNRVAPPAWQPRLQRSDKLVFYLVWLYLVAQAYSLPLAMIGPVWAVWPSLADLVSCSAGVLLFFNLSRTSPVHRSLAWLRESLWLLALLAMASTVLVGWGIPMAFTTDGPDRDGMNFGIFQSYRVIQFAIIVDCACRIVWTPQRQRLLHWTLLVVLLINCGAIFATFSQIVAPGFYAPQLTDDPGYGGPWAFYHSSHDAWGVTGYNHAYTAAQVVMLTAIWISLGAGKITLTNSTILLIATFAVLVSESRAGLACMLVCASCIWIQKPVIAGIAGMILLAVGLTSSGLGDVGADFEELLSRQATLLDATNTENLSGRDDIWGRWLKRLDERPHQWLLGAGFGATSGDSAHMQPLHTIIEVGLVGLLFYCIFFWKVLRKLWLVEISPKPMLCALMGFLPTLLTQETFYPVHAMGHFCGLTMVGVILAYHKGFATSRKLV